LIVKEQIVNVYLIRHGDAEPASYQVKDFDRQLTEEGKETLRKAVQGWTKLISTFDYIVSSPLVRAIQTAEIVKEIFNVKNDLIFDRCIVSGDTKSVIDLANALRSNNVAFVGHEPSFSHYTAELIAAPGAYINFKKGMIAKIRFEGKARLGSGELEFLIPAKSYK
jgi:phosphohistidine phosphatase